MISVYDMDDAVDETRRVAGEYGFRSVFLRSNIVTGKPLHDPYYEPLWDTLEELGLPIGFHEASGSSAPQSGEQFEPNFGLRRVYAQPFEQMMCLGSFLGGGVLARHPRLKVAFLEANCSWLPWLLWRLDEGYEREGDIFMTDLLIILRRERMHSRQCPRLRRSLKGSPSWSNVSCSELVRRETVSKRFLVSANSGLSCRVLTASEIANLAGNRAGEFDPIAKIIITRYRRTMRLVGGMVKRHRTVSIGSDCRLAQRQSTGQVHQIAGSDELLKRPANRWVFAVA